MQGNYTQLTPQNAEGFLRIMREKAARGPVSVTARNIVGARPFRGHLTFDLVTRDGLGLEARTSSGTAMNTPVMPQDFTPQREGDAVAFYKIEGNVVTIRYQHLGHESQRTFTFA